MSELRRRKLAPGYIEATIAGHKWSIRLDKKVSGASFSFTGYKMLIGTKDKEQIVENIYHEVGEICFCQHSLRYTPELKAPGNGDYLFIFNHKEFQNAIRDTANAVTEILDKIKKEAVR